MKAKQIHLDEKVIEILTIKAVKEKTTFKELVQKILTDKSKEYCCKHENIDRSDGLDECLDCGIRNY